MSKLYYTEQGRVISTMGEELTTFRHARKRLHLPGSAAPATLYVLARPYAGSDFPLRLSVNGVELPAIQPGSYAAFFWYSVTIKAGRLRPGANEFEFWCDSTAMNAWSLALEGGHARPESYVSDDGGLTWRNERIGYLNVMNGEYAVRVRLAEGDDPAPPPMIWEDPTHPRLAHLRQMLPTEAAAPGPLLRRVRALTAWISTSWQHVASDKAALYAPWDAETLLAWGRVRLGHDGRLPITMCVHYGLTFVMACQALEIPARCLVGMGPDGHDGHFLAEVWFDELGKWVVADANADAVFCKQGEPLSAAEIRAEGENLAGLAEWGPGTQYQRRYPPIQDFVTNNYLKGLWLAHRGLWPRTDFFSHPELTSPGHGGTGYSEINLVWEAGDLGRGLGMFPYFGDRDYFEAPPES